MLHPLLRPPTLTGLETLWFCFSGKKISYFLLDVGAAQVALLVKIPPANAGGLRDVGLSPG